MSTYTDASYATYMNIKGRAGDIIRLGKGTIHTKLLKQANYTKISI